MVQKVPVIPAPSDKWAEKLRAQPAIDPGEAQLYAVAAERELMVLSGDKRALRTLKDIGGFPEALRGRIVSLEAVLVLLCDKIGPDALRQRLQPALPMDTMLQVCLSPGNAAPRDALLTYQRTLVKDVQPLVLLDPVKGGGS